MGKTFLDIFLLMLHFLTFNCKDQHYFMGFFSFIYFYWIENCFCSPPDICWNFWLHRCTDVFGYIFFGFRIIIGFKVSFSSLEVSFWIRKISWKIHTKLLFPNSWYPSSQKFPIHFSQSPFSFFILRSQPSKNNSIISTRKTMKGKTRKLD